MAVIEGNAHILRRILSGAGIYDRAEQTIRLITDSVERMSKGNGRVALVPGR